jgi:adenylate cyclase
MSMTNFRLTSIFGSVFLINLLTVGFGNSLMLLMIPPQYVEILQTQARTIDRFVFPITFFIPLVFVHIYTKPIYNYFLENQTKLLQISRIRSVNAPLWISVFAMVGWGIGILSNVVYSYSVGIKMNSELQIRLYLHALEVSFFSFGLGYFTLDYLIRRNIIPMLFPDADVSNLKGVLNLSVFTRFGLYFFTVGVFPVMVYEDFLIHLKGSIFSQDTEFYAMIIGVVFLINGIYLTYIVADGFRRPLKKLEFAVQEVGKGKLEFHLTVDSVDEMGKVAEGFNKMTKGLLDRDRIRNIFGRMVDERVRDYVLNLDTNLVGEKIKATVMFVDIRGFTSLSETLSAEKTVEFLNIFLNRMSSCITKNEGIINKYLGDGFLAVFGAPIPKVNSVELAIKAGIEIQIELEKWNEERLGQGEKTVKLGIGIHYGDLISGTIGSSDRMEYTVIGDTVNVASRIQELTKKLGFPFLMSGEANNQIINHHFYIKTFAGQEILRGRTTPIDLWSLEYKSSKEITI